MEIRFVAYDRLGARRGVIPNPLDASVSKAYNELTTLKLHYDRQSPKHEYLENEPELAVEVLRDGEWVEIRDARLRCLSNDFDHLEEVPTRTYDFLGVGEALKGVLVYARYSLPLNDEGRVNFGKTNVGRVIDTIWANAVSRGWSGFDNTFTSTEDSAGNAWDKSFTISYDVDTNLLSILNSFVAMGLVDVVWQGRTLNLYNKGYLETNLSTGPNPQRFVGTGDASGVDSAPEKNDLSSLATHIVVLGEKGARWEFPTGAEVAEGRREIVQSYSGVDDLATAQILAAPLILRAQNHLKNTTRQFHLTPATKFLPFVDYEVGNWIDTQRGNTFESLQIISLNIQVNENGTQGYVTLGDKIDGLLERMYQRIQGLTGGVQNEGTKPPVSSLRKPKAPNNLSGSASVFVDETGKSVGGANIAWSQDPVDILGSFIEVKSYRGYYREVGAKKWILGFTTSDTDGAVSPLQVYNTNKTFKKYELAVQSVSNKDVLSDMSVPVTVTMIGDVIPPPVPTAPTVSVWLRTPKIDWDGQGINDSGIHVDMPTDFSHIIVWSASDSQMTDKVEIGRLGAGRSVHDIQRPADVTRWYALQAYDYTGNASPMSDVASVTPTDLITEQSISDALDKLNGDIGNNVNATTAAAQKAADAEAAAEAARLAAIDAQADATQGVEDALAAKQAADAASADAAAATAAAQAAKDAADRAQAAASNVVADPSFESDIWPLDPRVSFDPLKKHTGARSLKIIAGAGDAEIARTLRVDVAEGQTWRYRIWYLTSPDYNGVLGGLRLNDQADALIDSDVFYPQATWSMLESEYTVTTETELYLTAVADHTVGDLWVDDLELTNITDAKATRAIADAAAADAQSATNTANAAQADATQGIADALEAKSVADAAKAQADKALADAKTAADAAEAARLLAVAAQSTADGKTTVSVNAPTNADLAGKPANAMWTQVVGGKAVGAWYKAAADSTSWTAMPFDPVMIPQINIGTGTFGELDGIRLSANSVKAKTLFVGSYSNQVPNGDGDAGVGWGALPLDTMMVPLGAGIAGSFKAVPTQRTAQDHGELWLIDRTRNQLVTAWAYADAADSRCYVQVLFYDRTKTYINTTFYAIENMPVPTIWTKFSAKFSPTDTPGFQTMPSNAMYASIRILPNHVNGTAVANQYFAGITMREMEAGELIVDGSVKARHVGANQVTADKLEADLALVTRIIAGPSTGVHAQMDPNGFKVFGVSPDDGTPYETVRMGVSSTDDLFALSDSSGTPTIQADSTGTFTARSVEAADTLYYRGEELSSYVGSRPRGMAAWGQVPITANMSTASEVGLFELAWDAGDDPARMYRFQLDNFIIDCSSPGTVGLRLRVTYDGTPPTVNSQILSYNYMKREAAGFVNMNLSRIIGSNNGNYIRILVCLYAASGSVATVYNGVGQAYLYSTVMDLGQTMDTTHVATTGGGTPYTGSTVASPTIAKVTKTVEYGYSSVRSYLASGAQYAYNVSKAYQGLSPAGYGNLNSMYGFNQNFASLLSGATINGIWVYLYFEHWYNNAGGTAYIRLHNNAAVPSTYVGMTTNGVNSGGWPKGAGRWVALPSSLWAGFASGAYKGFGLIGDNTYNSYGIANNARIRIKYTK